MRIPVALALLVVSVTAVLGAYSSSADTAIAATTKPSVIWGYAFGFSSDSEARAQAITSCAQDGGEGCKVIKECRGGGYGSIYVWPSSPGANVEALGVACGADTEVNAKAEARRVCEWQVAKNLEAIQVPLKDASMELIRQALARSCPGMGNCQCGEWKSWLDRSDAS